MTFRTLVRCAGMGALLLTAACDREPRDTQLSKEPPNHAARATPEAGEVSTHRAPLGEVVNGFPHDQERMVLLLTNLARHSPKNDCGDWTEEQAGKIPMRPLLYTNVGNQAARYTSQHMGDIGCFQHESCCVLGNVGGQVECTAPANCDSDQCGKQCSGGSTIGERYGLLGFTAYSGENIARGYPTAHAVWCGWMNSDGHRANIYSGHTQLGVGMIGSASCGRYWTQAFGSDNVAVPRIPVASAMHGSQPNDAANLYFAANYYDNSGAPPQRAAVVVDGVCIDLQRNWGTDGNGTWEAHFTEPDAIPAGCQPYYFLFVDGEATRHTYPDTGSLHVAIGDSTVSCPESYTAGQKPADCETGQQTCEEGETRPCYSGPDGTLGIGACKEGFQTCRNGFWSGCQGQRVPTPETCDGLDNNCDGTVDEGITYPIPECDIFEEYGQCKKGHAQCIAGNTVCVSLYGPQSEVCDGEDNDCDNVIDDGLGTLFCGQGDCFRSTPACVGGVEQTCVPGEPSAEVADNRDNDCDGHVDNGIACGTPGGVRLCYGYHQGLPDGGTQPLIAPCQRGVQTCGEDGGWGDCEGDVGPEQEVCDGVDNDCDGTVDDPEELGYQRCGTGICVNTGRTCIAGNPATCQPRPATAETCNKLDDNCDGTIDEGCQCPEGAEVQCYAGAPSTLGIGVCAGGVQKCEQGMWSTCQGQVTPGIEYCNSEDDDCDGTVDEECIQVATDAGTNGGGGGAPDAGDGGGDEGGCGCAAGAGGAGMLPPLLLVLGLAGWRRRAYPLG